MTSFRCDDVVTLQFDCMDVLCLGAHAQGQVCELGAPDCLLHETVHIQLLLLVVTPAHAGLTPARI